MSKRSLPDDPHARAAYHAEEAERLLRSWWISSHVQGQLHATLALYYVSNAASENKLASPAA